jgi:mannosyltransferase
MPQTAFQRRLLEITLVLLLAASIRITNSSHWPVWTDEGWTIWSVSSHDFPQIINNLAQDRHPPAYFLTLSAWSSAAGESRLALRFLSTAIGLLTVAVVYRIGRDVFGHPSGIYAALLLAALPIPVYYSQEIRHYGLLALATALMSFFFLRYLRHPTPGRLIPYVLSTLLMLYTQFLGLALLGVQILFILILWRRPLRVKVYLFAAWIITFILYLPWLPTALVQIRSIAHTGTVNNFFGSYSQYNLGDFARVLDSLFGGQLVVLGSAYLLGLAALRRVEQTYIVLSGLGLYAALFLISLKTDILAPRALLFVLPMLILICGKGFQQIAIPHLRLLLISLTLLVVLISPGIVQRRLAGDSIAQEVANRVNSNDLVVVEMGWDSDAIKYELGQAGVKSAIFLPWLPLNANSRDMNVSQINDLRPLLRRYSRILVLNWKQPQYAIPLLEDSRYGYHEALDNDLSIGNQLTTLVDDQTVQTVLFERFDANGIQHQFGDMFDLRGAVLPTAAHPGETIFADLWWSANTKPNLDYSIGTYLFDGAQHVVAQNDGQPGELPTSQWQVGDLHFDRHSITIPANLAEGSYQIGVGVYWYGDQRPLPVDGNPFASIGQISVSDTGS